MGAHSTQGWAVLIFLVAFALLGGAFFGGGLLLLLAFLIVAGASVAMFMKAKSVDALEK